MVTILDSITLGIIAIFIGIASSMVGIGGGSLVVPLLDTLYGLAHEVSVGTSSAMIVSTALSSSFAYARQRRIDYKVGTAMMIGTIPTAYLGGQALGMMKTLFGASSSDIGRGLFGVFLILLALRMIFISTKDMTARRIERWAWERKIVDSHGHIFNYRADMARGLALSVIAGFASGFFGVGGGAVTVPIMTMVMHIPMHIAVATSMFTMILTSLSSTASHLSQGNVVLAFAASLSVGIIVGTQLGAWLARRSNPRQLQKEFAALILIIGVMMIQSSLAKLLG
ncbi:MAG: sulfite exporter TauE/SafE family protein [archaeon]